MCTSRDVPQLPVSIRQTALRTTSAWSILDSQQLPLNQLHNVGFRHPQRSDAWARMGGERTFPAVSADSLDAEWSSQQEVWPGNKNDCDGLRGISHGFLAV
ncbi:hypothetical protein ANCDUO_16570 [Ancylostoma duodenale]|uniref:Uncharacterized protein n=1 Tax=Ancylostoma duodenale TaxID=51022 RepID=A0A0C2FXK9_9BILA|nr:hypothetical protein ANCDUO_16570 [Ancylostoma duodenale]